MPDSAVDQLLFTHDPTVRETALSLRDLVLELMPDAVE